MTENSQFHVPWRDNYSVGIVEIDQQHQKLLNQVDECIMYAHHNLSEAGMRALLRELVDFVKNHFQFEEDLMFLFNFAEAKEHRENHKFFLTQMNHLIGRNQLFNGSHAQWVLRFFRNWFVGHIAVEDQAYAAFVNQISEEDFHNFLKNHPI